MKPLYMIHAIALAIGITSPAWGSRAEDLPKRERFILCTPFVSYSFFEPVKQGMTDAARALGVEATFSGTPDGNITMDEGYHLITDLVDDAVRWMQTRVAAKVDSVPDRAAADKDVGTSFGF